MTNKFVCLWLYLLRWILFCHAKPEQESIDYVLHYSEFLYRITKISFVWNMVTLSIFILLDIWKNSSFNEVGRKSRETVIHGIFVIFIKKTTLSLNRKIFLAHKTLTLFSSQKNIKIFWYFNVRVKLTCSNTKASRQKLFSRYVKKSILYMKKEFFCK